MKAPTPLELMAYYDGELDEARAREIRARLAAGGEDAALVDGFRALGRHVRTVAPSPAPPFDLADSIMAALDAEVAPSQSRPSVKPSVPAVEAPAPLLPLRHPSAGDALAPVLTLRQPGAAQAPAAQGPRPAASERPAAPGPAAAGPSLAAQGPAAVEGPRAAPGAVVALPRPASVSPRPAGASPRPVAPVVRRALGWASLGAAGMALAAAAAFSFWWSPASFGPRPEGLGPTSAIMVNPSAAFGTDVDSVDFGVRMGSIFFVSNDSQATPVLWIDDDDDDNGDAADQ
ncbi:MAG TPA: hypothetical protein VFS00_00650 [Polyangiaceae bacterium]|nr:hypothetical protein [Polyangiaceae bacterium]